MPVPAKLAAFLAVLSAVFGFAYLTGTQSAALLAPPPPAHRGSLGGLTPSLDGYTLTAVSPVLEPGPDRVVDLRLTGPDGAAVNAFDEVDGAVGHLFAIREDLAGFAHHELAAPAGTAWLAGLDLAPGPWRVVVELQPAALGRPILLGVDLTVRGGYRAEAPPPAADEVGVRGLQVRRSGELSSRREASLAFTVAADGQPVTDLQQRHHSTGHAVLVRPGDLALAHLHAVGTSRGPRLEFSGTAPERGRYAVLVQFWRADRPHVAAYGIEVPR